MNNGNLGDGLEKSWGDTKREVTSLVVGGFNHINVFNWDKLEDTYETDWETGENVVDDPVGAVEAIAKGIGQPVIDSYESGGVDEAIGRLPGAVAGVVGGKGINKLDELDAPESAGDAGEGVPPAGRDGAGAAKPPNRIYSARELRRRVEEPGPYHNFPESFDQQIFERGSRTVVPNFFPEGKRGLSNDSVQYRLQGEINGRSGTYEIFARPSHSGRNEVITHRFFRPNP